MRVHDIIRAKGDEVATISAGDTVDDAVRMMSEWRVGALVVSDDQSTVDGILSERDIVRHLHGGADTLAKRVGELMTADVVACSTGDTIAELMELMTERRIRHLPVVEDGALAGIVSIGDVVKARLGELEEERRHLESYITSGR